MKKVLCIVLVMASVAMMASCSSPQYGYAGKGDVLIHWDQMKEDASLRQFKKAKKANQIEILNTLVDRAESEFYKCKTKDDLNNLNQQMDLLRFYNNQAKMKSTNITYKINNLQARIDDVIRSSGGTVNPVIVSPSNVDPYRYRGQDVD